MTAEEADVESPRKLALTDLLGALTLTAVVTGTALFWRQSLVLVLAAAAVLVVRKLERLRWIEPAGAVAFTGFLERLVAALLGALLISGAVILYQGRFPPVNWTAPAIGAAVGGWLGFRFPRVLSRRLT